MSERTERHTWFRGSRSCHLAVSGGGREVCSAASSCLLGFHFTENESYCKLYCISTKGLSARLPLCVCVRVPMCKHISLGSSLEVGLLKPHVSGCLCTICFFCTSDEPASLAMFRMCLSMQPNITTIHKLPQEGIPVFPKRGIVSCV